MSGEDVGIEDTVFFGELHDAGVQLVPSDLAAIEEEIGASLPPDYRAFLLLKNGGWFYRDILFPMPTNEIGVNLGIRIVCRLREPVGEELHDLRNVMDVHSGRIPPGTVPIADDGDNLILLDVGSEVYGTVWLWVRDDEMSKEASENRIFVAPSFDLFAAGCRRDWPPLFPSQEPLEPFRAIANDDCEVLVKCLNEGLSPNSINEKGVPVLAFACIEHNYMAVDLLLSKGADPDLLDPRTGFPPLYLAASGGMFDLARLLLSRGASPHMPHDPSRKIVDALMWPPSRRMADLLRGVVG
jgi:hypothetical protein